MLEIGTVYKIDKKNRATVRFPRKTACENCHMCLKPKDEMFVELNLENTLNAKVSDRVSVSMGEQAVLTASVIAYAVPVVLVAISLFASRSLSNMVSFGISMGVLVFSFVCVALLDKFVLRKKKKFIPQMVAIVTENEGKINTEEKSSEDKENE